LVTSAPGFSEPKYSSVRRKDSPSGRPSSEPSPSDGAAPFRAAASSVPTREYNASVVTASARARTTHSHAASTVVLRIRAVLAIFFVIFSSPF
jgi:hypothetical protein